MSRSCVNRTGNAYVLVLLITCKSGFCLVAEQSVFTSQDTLAQTQRDVALQLVALYKAVGGGWEAGATAREASGNGSS